MKRIILASASPRRRELMETAGFDFEVCIEQVDESFPEGTEPEDAAQMTAQKKALAVAEKHRGDIVIGADTVVVSHGRILGKPADKAQAAEMLSLLSGGEHTVITGVCIVSGEKIKTFYQASKVFFYQLSDAQIHEYVETLEPMDKAGAYGIQGRGCLLVEKIEGDYFNIVGLPVARLSREMAQFL